jgi:hypothetical protein
MVLYVGCFLDTENRGRRHEEGLQIFFAVIEKEVCLWKDAEGQERRNLYLLSAC